MAPGTINSIESTRLLIIVSLNGLQKYEKEAYNIGNIAADCIKF